MNVLADPVEFTRALIRYPSITPADEGVLGFLGDQLHELGFHLHHLPFDGDGGVRVENLYARWGRSGPNFCFAGHTDVVPVGEATDWRHPPFDAVIDDGFLWGRGAADMKGAVAAFTVAASRFIASRKMTPGAFPGSISLLITGDEEGPAINGTRKMLGWLKENGQSVDHCLVGEPTSVERLGDMVKVGRRGSANSVLTVRGVQGHVAYPHRAHNPVPALLKYLSALDDTPLDHGYEAFQPSSLQITDVHVGNKATNVIPAKAAGRFNIRFNPNWTPVTIEKWIRSCLDDHREDAGLAYDLNCTVSGDSFLTTDDAFLDVLTTAIHRVTGVTPERSTSGGTSDARFIKDVAPVAEFGLIGATIHQIDERAPTADIETLTDIYEAILDRYFFNI